MACQARARAAAPVHPNAVQLRPLKTQAAT